MLVRSGAIRMSVTSRMRSVTAAAAASEISDSKLGYTTRSMVPSEEKPAASARRAHSTIPARSTPRTALGSPIPMSMLVLLSLSTYRGPMAAAPNVEGLPRWALELLDAARVGHLGLIDDHGRPRVLPVTFALVAGDGVERGRRQAQAPPGRAARARALATRPSRGDADRRPLRGRLERARVGAARRDRRGPRLRPPRRRSSRRSPSATRSTASARRAARCCASPPSTSCAGAPPASSRRAALFGRCGGGDDPGRRRRAHAAVGVANSASTSRSAAAICGRQRSAARRRAARPRRPGRA